MTKAQRRSALIAMLIFLGVLVAGLAAPFFLPLLQRVDVTEVGASQAARQSSLAF